MLSDKEFRLLFKNNLKRLIDEKKCTQKEIGDALGVSDSIVNQWVRGVKIPRMKNIDKLCAFFMCSRSDLIEEQQEEATHYYHDIEVAQMANELKDNPDMRILFNASKNLSKKDLEAVITIVQSMRGRE